MSTCTELKFWLIKNGISQSKLADDTGLHKNTVSKLVRTGECTKSVKMLARLYLGIDADEFDKLLEPI
jgi:transcriptional regulator with XRE-family HTH domain